LTIPRPTCLAPLRNPKAFARAVVIGREGWTVEWPSLDIQIGADKLWLDARAQNAPDANTRLFGQERSRHTLSLTEAAKALGMTMFNQVNAFDARAETLS
jgi:hypothetical protein